jgi:hypothetical protein
MFNVVKTHVDCLWEFEVVVDLLPTEIIEIKVETLQVEDEVVRCSLETGPAIVSFV